MFLTSKELGLNQQQIDEICERLWKEKLATSHNHCHDCDAEPGERHLDGCDTARCSSCGGQRLSCCCEDGEPDIWTGLWSGIKECYEQKLIAFDTCLHPTTNKYLGWCFDLNEWTRIVRRSFVSKDQWGVHETHCCKDHCKYGNENCPVVNELTHGISLEDFEKGF